MHATAQSLACQSLAAASAAASQPMPDLAAMQMHLPEEELAAVLKQPALMSGVTGLDTINKMFQRQARRLELQLVQQVQNKHAIELALETLQADLQVQKQQSSQQGKRLARVHEATREMDKLGIDLPIREGLGVDEKAALSEDEPRWPLLAEHLFGSPFALRWRSIR